MAAGTPPQRPRCPTYPWCVERTAGHRLHVGEAEVLATSRGTELRVSLSAEGPDEPVVQIEATFEHGGPMMELAGLDVGEALTLAGFLLRVGRVAQEAGRGVR